MSVVSVFGQTAASECGMVSTVKTFYFGIETEAAGFDYVLTSGHTDLEVSFTSAGWDVLVSHGGNLTNPADTLLYANENTKWEDMPSGFEFTGAEAGEPIWIFPERNQNGALRPGFAAERAVADGLCQWDPADERGADEPEKWFEVQLRDVRGPENGYFSLWQDVGYVFMSSYEGGISEDDVYYLTEGAHVHLNWGFTQKGFYEIDLEISTVVVCDSWLTADIWPTGDEYYQGDCRVDFYDFAVLANHWLRMDCADNADFCDGAGFIAEPYDQVGIEDVAELTNQWLYCGYVGCRL